MDMVLTTDFVDVFFPPSNRDEIRYRKDLKERGAWEQGGVGHCTECGAMVSEVHFVTHARWHIR